MAPSSRILRLLALAVVVAVAYFAQYIFDHGTLQALYPAWVLERLPFLQPTTLWLSEDLHTLALWLYAACALAFGLLVPGWEEQPAAELPPAPSSSAPSSVTKSASPSSHAPLLPAWAWLGIILLGTAVLVGWGWTSLPARIDPQTATAGLQAQALLAGGGSPLAAGATGAPQLAYFPMALAGAITRSLPAASHLVGLLTALGLVAATSLLAVELFYLSPQRRGLAVLAAGFAAATAAVLHFGRLAPFLPATALGTFAAWALLRGQRRGSAPLLAASGVFGGAALWFDRTGLLLAPVLLLWWLGLWLLLRGERPFYWQQLAVFAGGYLLAAAPLLVVWLLNPAALPAYWRGGTAEAAMLGDWWFNLRASAATLFWTHDASRVFGYPGPLVPSVVTPLFVLGVGALLLNLDRLVGWCMLTWMGSVLLLAAAASPLAPDWPLLLPLLPAVGVTIVFALERMGALWSQASHEAGSSAAASLAGGLLLAAVVLTWIGYYGFAAGGSAVGGGGIANASATPAASRYAASYTGRALGELAPAGVAVLAASAPEFAVALDDPVLRFAAGSRVNQALAVGVDALPASLPPGSQVFVQGGDRLALSAARARYPGASVAVVRDLQANPQLFVLRLP